VLDVVGDGKTAQHRVAELVTAQVPGRRHHPAHAERGAELLGMAAAARPGPDHLLQRDDIGIDRPQDGCDTIRTGAAVEAAASMNVVSGNPQSRTRRLGHYAMIVAVVAAAALGPATAGCSSPPADPIQLERNLITVDNRSSTDWNNVEIWINTYYRVTSASIPAGGHFQAPLDTFVAGYGQRFDFRKMQIVDVRVAAKLPDGRPLELKKQFPAGGVAGYLGGKR